VALLDVTVSGHASPLRPSLLLQRTLRGTLVDDCLTMAAALSFYLFLALFPVLLFLVALTSFFPGDLLARLVTSLGAITPPSLTSLVWDQLQKVTARPHPGLLTLGFAGAVWGTTAAAVEVMAAVNRAYDLPLTRGWWRQRFIALVLMIVLSGFVLTSFLLVVSGPILAYRIAGRIGLAVVASWSWKIARWPVVFLLVAIAFGIVYYVAPNRRQRARRVVPGAIAGAGLWFALSLLFKIYVVTVGNYNATYGAISGAIVTLLWLYLSGLVMLVGAQLNAEIGHAMVEHRSGANAPRPEAPSRTG
jgi:membrane protein